MDTAIFLNGGRRVLPGTHVPPQAPMRHRFWASSGALCTDLLSVVCVVPIDLLEGWYPANTEGFYRGRARRGRAVGLIGSRH